MNFSESKAREVIAAYWDNNLPVDPFDIAKKAGVEYHKAYMHESGSIEYINGKPLCKISATENLTRQRFTMAHELGHYFLNHGDAFRDDSSTLGRGANHIEVMANQFAAELLMPSSLVEHFIARGVTSPNRLAEQFNVSPIAMRIRMAKLGYLPQWMV